MLNVNCECISQKHEHMNHCVSTQSDIVMLRLVYMISCYHNIHSIITTSTFYYISLCHTFITSETETCGLKKR